MDWKIMDFDGYPLRVLETGAAVVGTGAAGFNAADQLWKQGCRDMVLVTEGIHCGTSRNTGADKQTYYKLTLSGGEPDSVADMAQTYFEGHCMDGDHALAEAANSATAFLRLCELGVPFPTNRFGEYVGYKTDHDPRTRATSVGPLTARKITEALEQSVMSHGITILDGLLVVALLVQDGAVKGLLCLDQNAARREDAYAAICCSSVIWATGGPAGMYADSVYPIGHAGMSGVPLEAGARGKNLTEWQFGLASVNPRWNVSGTYMQVLPRIFSQDTETGEEFEFLSDFFSSTAELCSKVFLKGYQWPFDVRRIKGGSSIVDVLVYIETCLKGRKVYLDYRSNPGGGDIDFAALEPQARDYLRSAGADFGRPIDRLVHMNSLAVDFYRGHGIDLYTQPLEIALCAQHNNGGLDVDGWWQTNLRGLAAAGEVAGTHGVYRPGGSALNAGQVGSMRAARYTALRGDLTPDAAGFAAACGDTLREQLARYDALLRGGESNVSALWHEAQTVMSKIGGPIRDVEAIGPAVAEIRTKRQLFNETVRATDIRDLGQAYHYYDALVCQEAYLGAMADYSAKGGASRGSAIYRDAAGEKPYDCLPDLFTFRLDDGTLDNTVQITAQDAGSWQYSWRAVRPIPQEDRFFENVWRAYREDGNVH